MAKKLPRSISKFLFEANMLKDTPRSGYAFLGVGQESVAEHSFMTTMIGYALSSLVPDADPLKLISMCLIHDLPEVRTGDLNYVQKKYVMVDESKVVRDMIEELPFGSQLEDLIREYSEAASLEAKLAHDADQIALILELKALVDIGYEPPIKWLPHVVERLTTSVGKELSEIILKTRRDAWWIDNYIDRPDGTH